MNTGRVFQISRFCLNDGDGIRTTVFLSGCRLRCRWCHNPEGLNLLGGKEMTVEQVKREVLKDRSFYETSGGGVTLSGGEPLIQTNFCLELLQRLHNEGVHTAIETSGSVPSADIKRILPYTDCFLYDCKLTDSDKLKNYCGGDAALIAANLDILEAAQARVILRCPLIPTINDVNEHFLSVARLASAHSCISEIHLLPYHEFGIVKYEGLPYECYRFPLMSDARGRAIARLIAANCNKPVIFCE